MSGEPFPKSAQLARGERRYRRKVASPKQWQAIIAAKGRRCRLSDHKCFHDGIEYHHLVSRGSGLGDDVADNIIPLCRYHHFYVGLHSTTSALLLSKLSDAEYAYMIERGGEDYPERAYGVRYER